MCLLFSVSTCRKFFEIRNRAMTARFKPSACFNRKKRPGIRGEFSDTRGQGDEGAVLSSCHANKSVSCGLSKARTREEGMKRYKTRQNVGEENILRGTKAVTREQKE